MKELNLADFDGIPDGPWQWIGNATSHSIYLATTHSGRRFVMQFSRWGMTGAQPVFQPADKGMVPASELLRFEVGDADVVGVDAAKQNGTVYRYDIAAIDCPAARAIAAIPELLAEVRRLREENARLNDADAFSRRELARGNEIIDQLRAESATDKATIERLERELSEAVGGETRGNNNFGKIADILKLEVWSEEEIVEAVRARIATLERERAEARQVAVKHIEKNDSLLLRIAELRREREEMGKDKARLDWVFDFLNRSECPPSKWSREMVDDAAREAEQAAFEDWCDRNSPSGDCESVQRQWEASSDYADLNSTQERNEP